MQECSTNAIIFHHAKSVTTVKTVKHSITVAALSWSIKLKSAMTILKPRTFCMLREIPPCPLTCDLQFAVVIFLTLIRNKFNFEQTSSIINTTKWQKDKDLQSWPVIVVAKPPQAVITNVSQLRINSTPWKLSTNDLTRNGYTVQPILVRT